MGNESAGNEGGDMEFSLLMACSEGRQDDALRLIGEGARPSFRDARGKTALIAAAERDMAPVLEALVAAGASTEERMEGGITALTQAARIGNPSACMTLLGLGADPRATEDDGETALHLCPLEEGGKMSHVAKALMARGADVEARDGAGATPLFISALLGNARLCALLLDAGANPETGDDHGNKAMDMAAGQCSALLGAAMERRVLGRESDKASVVGGKRLPAPVRAMRL